MFINLKEKDRERNIDKLPPISTLMGWNCNLGTCPDRELKPQHFVLWDDASTN